MFKVTYRTPLSIFFFSNVILCINISRMEPKIFFYFLYTVFVTKNTISIFFLEIIFDKNQSVGAKNFFLLFYTYIK